MNILILALTAVTSYLVGGWNPAITFSRLVYKKDIRECGSGNPGFTNFKRCFGNRLAWFVLILDLAKAAVVCVSFAFISESRFGYFQLGALYAGAFALLGHAYPVWYGFKGGKGFLVCLSVVYVADLRAGLIATAVMIVLLLVTRYMSLSTVSSLLISPALLALFGAKLSVVLCCLALALFVAARHRENFKRLLSGNERKFYIIKKQSDSK